MESKRNDGGQAFPMIDVAIDGNAIGSAGMSLRDWFAGQALAAWVASADAFNDECRERGSSTRIEADDTATSCYQYADAMLKARAE
jgi:hypothetical protein